MLFAALSIGTITYLDCSSDKHDCAEVSSKMEREAFLRLGTKEEMRWSIFSTIRDFHSSNAALDVFNLELQEDMHSSKPLTILSFALLHEKGCGTRT